MHIRDSASFSIHSEQTEGEVTGELAQEQKVQDNKQEEKAMKNMRVLGTRIVKKKKVFF